MKKLLQILLFTIISLPAIAQVEHNYRHSVRVSGGVSIPGSEFANATSIDVKDYVDRGIFLTASYKFDIFRYLAVGTTVGYSRNELNEQAIEEASSTSINTVPWTSTFIVADLYAQLPFRRWEFFLRGSAGAALPNEWEFYAEQENNNGTFLKGNTRTADEVTMAYMTGVGVNFTANRFVIGVESGVLAYKPTFEIDLNGSPGTRKEWIATFNQTLRLGYKF